jgi:ABC-type glycerol-3-phosphate transport system substrate-binding protein
MIKSKTYVRMATCMTLVAGVTVLSACGSTPTSRTTTSEQTTITTPAPTTSTVTTTSEQNTLRR